MSRKEADRPGKESRAKGVPIPRRAALLSAAAMAGALLWNPEAFAWEYASNPQDSSKVLGWSGTDSSHNFGSEGGTIDGDYSTLAYGLKCQTWTKWMHWNMGNGVGWLGTQMDLVSYTDYQNELFFHVDFQPLVAGFSNTVRSQGWQKSPTDDSAYTLRISWDRSATWTAAASGNFDLDTTERSPFPVHRSDGLDEGHYDYWTDLQLWGSSWDFFPRRGDSTREMWAQMAGSWWLFYHFGYQASDNQCTVSGQTRWLSQYVPEVRITRSPEDVPTCGLEWAGRILNIKSAADPRKSVFVGNSVVVAGNATGVGLWSGPEWTNRQWACGICSNGTTDPAAWSNSNRRQGTVSFANVMQIAEGSSAVWLNQYGGGPAKMYTAAACVYNGDGTAAEAFWVHTQGGKQYIFADSSGLALDRVNGSNDDGATVQFHSNGEGGDLNNAAHAWLLEDARFSLREGQVLKASATSPEGAARDDGQARPGDTVSFPDLAPLTYPKVGYGTTSNLHYDYMWVALDEKDDGTWLNDQVEVWARAHLSSLGTLNGEQPAINYVGAIGLYAMEAVHLRVKGSSLSGNIEYRFRERSTGKWQEWVSGSKDDDGAGVDTWAGKKGASFRADGFTARLTGDLGERYTLWYEVGSGTSGWSAWAAAGEDCIDSGSHFDALCIRILPKWCNGYKWGFGGSESSMKVTQDMVGKKLVPVARTCVAHGFDQYYLGTVAGASNSITVREPYIKVHYWADGEEMYVQDKVEVGKAYTLSADGIAACKRAGCDGITDFYTDADYKTPWANGTVTKDKDIFLYCRNKCTVRQALADESKDYFGQHEPFDDAGQDTPWDFGAYPRSSALTSQIYYNDTVKADDACDMPEKVWLDYMGSREVPRIKGGYGSREAKHTDAPKTSFTVKASMTIYYAYDLPRFDGFTAD